MNTLHIKKGDNVIIRSGVDKAKTGKVLEVFPKTSLVLVEGVGMYKKHQKPRKDGQKGQILDKYHPIHVSKVMLADKKSAKTAKTKKEPKAAAKPARHDAGQAAPKKKTAATK